MNNLKNIFRCQTILTIRSELRVTRTISGTGKQEITNKKWQAEEKFASAKIGTFFQDQPVIKNQYLQDSILRPYLQRTLEPEDFEQVDKDLERFGARVATEVAELGQQCEQEKPYLEPFDAWGNRIDKLVTCGAWKRLHGICAEEGIIATAYENQESKCRRLWQMSKVYLFSSSSGLYSCPIAMTDGAAVITQGLRHHYPFLNEAYKHLTSRQPSKFWTSGQWMTERRGGSDVANGTETVAVPQSDGTYKLYGYKWFSSATDADMTFTLARTVNEVGDTVTGTKGLSLFYVKLRNEDGTLNNVQIQKLKNKLGTRQLPTAELLLDGCQAYKVSEEGRGVPGIAAMLKLTRIHNSVAAASAMRKMLLLARDYSTKREAFGCVLQEYPLHMQTLARMELEVRGATLLTLECCRLLGKEDDGIATETDSLLLRLLTPLCKLYTAKQAMSVLSEGLESFGGQGYIEDTGLPVLLRDGQVLPIWEGTTNILSLDVLRALLKSQGAALHSWGQVIKGRLGAAREPSHPLSAAADNVTIATDDIIKFVQIHQNVMETSARDFAYSLARTTMASLMVEHAVKGGMIKTDVYAAQRWCEQELCLVHSRADQYQEQSYRDDFDVVFDHY